eukprot:TRINITY_DN1940_c1_g2_i1.p1 TRINITY_DN1940_c1_g2~~TRINITY_DN1940_c1_g2_i1.p1  ORF type:complete len:745 (+),score=205.64 TRINITY_DN1940_c1_g2_i1:138-2237(+)
MQTQRVVPPDPSEGRPVPALVHTALYIRTEHMDQMMAEFYSVNPGLKPPKAMVENPHIILKFAPSADDLAQLPSPGHLIGLTPAEYVSFGRLCVAIRFTYAARERYVSPWTEAVSRMAPDPWMAIWYAPPLTGPHPGPHGVPARQRQLEWLPAMPQPTADQKKPWPFGATVLGGVGWMYQGSIRPCFQPKQEHPMRYVPRQSATGSGHWREKKDKVEGEAGELYKRLLALASGEQHVAELRSLLPSRKAHDRDFGIWPQDNPLLHQFAKKGWAAGVAHMLQLGAKAGLQRGKDGATPLHCAVSAAATANCDSHVTALSEVIAVLLWHGADPFAKNGRGEKVAELAEAVINNCPVHCESPKHRDRARYRRGGDWAAPTPPSGTGSASNGRAAPFPATPTAWQPPPDIIADEPRSTDEPNVAQRLLSSIAQAQNGAQTPPTPPPTPPTGGPLPPAKAPPTTLSPGTRPAPGVSPPTPLAPPAPQAAEAGRRPPPAAEHRSPAAEPPVEPPPPPLRPGVAPDAEAARRHAEQLSGAPPTAPAPAVAPPGVAPDAAAAAQHARQHSQPPSVAPDAAAVARDARQRLGAPGVAADAAAAAQHAQRRAATAAAQPAVAPPPSPPPSPVDPPLGPSPTAAAAAAGRAAPLPGAPQAAASPRAPPLPSEQELRGMKTLQLIRLAQRLGVRGLESRAQYEAALRGLRR